MFSCHIDEKNVNFNKKHINRPTINTDINFNLIKLLILTYHSIRLAH